MHILDVIGGMPERPLSKLTSTDLLVGNKVGSWQMRVPLTPSAYKATRTFLMLVACSEHSPCRLTRCVQ